MKNKLSLPAVMLALTLLLTACGSSTPQTGTTTTPAPTEKAVDISLGHIEGSVYENAFTGYGCALDDAWTLYSAEELQDVSDLTQEALKDAELLEENEKYHYFVDMMAQNEADLTVMNVGYSYISLKERLASVLTSEEQLVDNTLAQADTMTSAYAESGITLNSMEKVKVNFLGGERWAIHSDTDIDGIPYYVLQIFDMKPGASYYVTLTLGSYVEDNTESLLDLFYPVSK